MLYLYFYIISFLILTLGLIYSSYTFLVVKLGWLIKICFLFVCRCLTLYTFGIFSSMPLIFGFHGDSLYMGLKLFLISPLIYLFSSVFFLEYIIEFPHICALSQKPIDFHFILLWLEKNCAYDFNFLNLLR